MEFYRDTWVEVDLNAIATNISNLRNFLPEHTKIMAVVKANGYGHGAFEVAQTALESGATWLGVALLDEAIKLRTQGIKAPILVLGYTRPEDINLACKLNIALTVFQEEWVELAKHVLQEERVYLHIKVDTGMGRLGLRDRETLQKVVAALSSDPRFTIQGIFTHFATASDLESKLFFEQIESFDRFVVWLKELGVNPELVHCANSAATLRKETKLYDMVRFGVSTYGLTPSPEMTPSLPFKLVPAFSLYSKLSHVKLINAGETIGYGANYKATKKTWIGTIPIGYADGWLRKLAGSEVIIGGERVKLAGNICMDQMMCELPKAYPVGEKVTLIGDGITVDEVADRLDTINYEVVCTISGRVPRVYKKHL